MIKVFISYCHENDDKRKILVSVLKNNGIDPIVVASRDKPAQLLATNIEDAMDEADYLIPILTEQSVMNQWVNQEIGYSHRLVLEHKIKIIPLVAAWLMEGDRLKGFIHKQMQLPFIFKDSESKSQENKAFKAQCVRVAEYLLNNSEHVKYSSVIKATFSHLSSRGLTNTGGLQLNSTITIENTSDRNFSIRSIEIEFPRPDSISNFMDPQILKFTSEYMVENGRTVSIKTAPIIIKPYDVKVIERLMLSSNEPINSRWREEVRDNLTKGLKDLEGVDAKVMLLSGEIIETKVNIIH